MRELTSEEMDQVQGGIAPLIGLAASAVGHFTARSLATSLVSRAGLATSVYGVADYFSDK